MRTATFKQSKIKPMRRGIGSKNKQTEKTHTKNEQLKPMLKQSSSNSEARETDGI